jgi:sugar lactone lactonase YvrE
MDRRRPPSPASAVLVRHDAQQPGPGRRKIPIDGPPGGSLGRIDPDGAVTRVDGPFGISNTLAWSPDHGSIRFGGTLGVIFARGFDLESGTGRDRRVHAPRDAAPALPDGEFAG